MSQFYKAKSDFAHSQNKGGLYSSDYLTNKKNNLTACLLKKNPNCKKRMTQSNYLALNNVILSQNYVYNTNYLLQNKFYIKNLYGVSVVGELYYQNPDEPNNIAYSSPTAISLCNVPFYAYYTIDPSNILYGNRCDTISDP